MTSTPASPDPLTSPSLPRRPTPLVRASAALWALAVGAGVAELVLGAADLLQQGAPPTEIAPVLILRGAVLAVAAGVVL